MSCRMRAAKFSLQGVLRVGLCVVFGVANVRGIVRKDMGLEKFSW